MDVIQSIFNGKGTKRSNDHDANDKEKIVKSHHHKKNAPTSQRQENAIKTDVDKSCSFLKVENSINDRRGSSMSGLSPNLARRTKAEKYMQTLDLDVDLDCNSSRERKSKGSAVTRQQQKKR